MNKINVHRFDLSISRDHARIHDPCKYIFIPAPFEGVYISFSSEGGLIDISRINEFYFPQGIYNFYITNQPQKGTLYIITANCGARFEDVYTLEEIRNMIENINEKWRRLLNADN